MVTLLSISLLVVSVPLTAFLAVIFWFWRISVKTSAASRRGMFGFNDGKHERWVDPISVMLAFENHPQYRADIHPNLVSQGNKEAISVLVDAVKHAFNVVDYSSPKLPGLTINEMIGLWQAFYDWVDMQKKSMQCDRIFAESTESTSRKYENQTTNCTSDSGLTDGEVLQSNP